MGFTSIKHWINSDNAAGLHSALTDEFRRRKTRLPLKTRVRRLVDQELKDMANEYNTPGFINLALLLEVEGKERGDPDDYIPVFSNLLTLTQLRKCSDLLADCEWKEEKRRLKALQRVVDKLVKSKL